MNIPYDGRNYYMVQPVGNTDGTIEHDDEIPEHFDTFKEAQTFALEQAKKWDMTFIVFQACAVEQVKKVRGRVVATSIVWKPKA